MLPKKDIDALMMPIGYYRWMFCCIIVISLLIAAIFIFLGIKYHESLLIIVGPLLSIVPAIFVRIKISLFAKKATIHFSGEFIEITTPDAMKDRFIYADIKYFSVSKIAVDYASRLSFILGNGDKRGYIFFRQLDKNESVLDNVLLYFSSYNIGKIQEEKIQVLPSFFLRRYGRLFVAVTGVLILAIIVAQVIYKPKTILYSLIAVLGAYIQIKIIQRNDMEILRKFRDDN